MPNGHEHDVVVIGGGFAGLSLGAALRVFGVRDFVIFEQGDDVGAFWAAHYDRIRLHSAFHDLPHDGGARRKYGIFLTRDELLGYFRAYVSHNDLAPHLRLGERVVRLRGRDERWEVEHERGACAAHYVAVATSANGVPVIPQLPGSETFGGRCLHSAEYRNAQPFRGDRVLVVGNGNSAVEIALDLVEGGAAEVRMWSRGPRHFIPLATMARIVRVLRFLRLDFTDRAFDRDHRLTKVDPEFRANLRRRDRMLAPLCTDLSRYGIRRPKDGPISEMLMKGRVPVFDQGAIPLIRSGAIHVIDGNLRPIRGFTRDGLRIGDEIESVDAVILACGYRAALDFVEEHDRLLAWDADRGQVMPITNGRCRSAIEPTLFFPGFDLTAIGGFSLGRWGWEVGRTIANELM
jgi:cation diffusion facilitator CzcD-associated flavoprotein CzcO